MAKKTDDKDKEQVNEQADKINLIKSKLEDHLLGRSKVDLQELYNLL